MTTDRKSLKAGQTLGHFRLIMRIQRGQKVTSGLRKQWRVECVCGTRKSMPEIYLCRKIGPTLHCGCQNKTDKTRYNNEYRIWLMIRQRCTNPKHRFFKHYGGRGISIYPEWFDLATGFDKFIVFVGKRPSLGHSIDRVDVDGNYEPYHPQTGAIQVRWATSREQMQNTRAKKREREKREIDNKKPP